MMERWKGRVALVTGASVGIGAAVARALVQHGMKVVGCARNVDKIEVSDVKTSSLTDCERSEASVMIWTSRYTCVSSLKSFSRNARLSFRRQKGRQIRLYSEVGCSFGKITAQLQSTCYSD